MSVKSLATGNRSVSLLAGNTPEHHILLAETTVGAGGTASVTFSNIPADYQHLQVRGTYISSSAGNGGVISFNSDTTYTNYRSHRLIGDGTSASSDTLQAALWTGAYALYSASTTYTSVSVIDILDYANTSKNKVTRSLHGVDINGAGGYVMLSSAVWLSTSAITSIRVAIINANLSQYSTFQLYGVK